jgi:hypothetical protein
VEGAIIEKTGKNLVVDLTKGQGIQRYMKLCPEVRNASTHSRANGKNHTQCWEKHVSPSLLMTF